MKLTYQTGIATLIQLAVMTLLNVANGFHSAVGQCTTSSTNNCIETTILSLLYLMVLTLWFGFLWIMGAAAQDRRSKRIAQILIAAEGMVFVVALFNAKQTLAHHGYLLGIFTSVVDAGLAAWIILLAFRLMWSKGGRVTASDRSRRRRLSN